MATVSTGNGPWISNALQCSKEQTIRSLEEMSMQVAKDLDWLQDYKTDAIASLLSHDAAGTETIDLEVTTQVEKLSENVIENLLLTNDMSLSRTSERVKKSTTPSTMEMHINKAEQVPLKNESQGIGTQGSSAIDTLVLDDASDKAQAHEAAQQGPLQVGIISEISQDSDAIPSGLRRSLPSAQHNEVIETNMIPLKIIGKRTNTQDKQVVPELSNPPQDQTSVVFTGQQQAAESTTNPQEIDTDYLQPINLNSPEKTSHRTDSAYYSAAESPSTTSVVHSSPRKSIAFASLPPRQPFAKKSLGPRSSQSHTSVFEGHRSSQKLFTRDPTEPIVVKLETLSTPQAVTRAEKSQVSKAVEHEKEHRSVDELQALHVSETSKDFLDRDIQNPFESVSAGKNVQSQVTAMSNTEDDDWLPRFETSLSSPRKPKQSSQAAESSLVANTALPKQSERLMAPETNISLMAENEKATPGPIKAAMQAASAKATSYLRQARTAFGSPSINHTKVFKSTTPMQSPPKPRFKTEPQTPKLYPNLDVSVHPIPKPSMIPSKTPSKSPEKSKVLAESPRRSPRRSPKKGTEATQSMAVIAARNATAKATTESSSDSHGLRQNIEQPRNDSPPKARLATKPVMHAKAKPLSIRVATASQREIDNTKDRKVQPSLTRMHEHSSVSILSRSTMEHGQLEYLNNSQQGNTKRPAPSRQIKALAAANQAKEKAEKEQERREQQKRELERKRQENAKRQVHEEEKRKHDMMDEMNKKRKAAEARVVSAKKLVVRPASTVGATRETHTKEHETMSMKDNRQSVKRALNEADENVINSALQDPKRQRISEQDENNNSIVHTGTTVISKPVRVSLQKKSLFGHPGEPGYKKPGTTAIIKPGPVVDSVKFSNDPIRFAVTNTATTTAVTTQEQIRVHNLPPSELIELPEINSDYSDSDDDEPAQKDTFERPNWAETPELRKLLRKQQRIDPDDVFGPIPPLQMEEIFKGKERALARFRPRSSSANWSGNDKLSAEEVTDYARAMGYKN